MSAARYARWQMQLLRANREVADPHFNLKIVIDRNRSIEDSEKLIGFSLWLDTIREIEFYLKDGEWTEEGICEACRKIGMNRKSVILSGMPKNPIIIRVKN